mgnify:FL=1|jgi:hypothetical protein
MKFDNVPTEADTAITLSLESKFGEYDVLYQQWIWDGIQANSLIFDNDDIADIELQSLIEEVRNSPLVNDASKELTIKSGEYFTFINFNFEQV